MAWNLGLLGAAGSGGVADSYDLLETTILDSSASSVTFTGLGSYSDYKHLQIRAVARTTRSGTADGLALRINNDTGNNYARHLIFGDGSSVQVFSEANDTFIALNRTAAASSATNAFGAIVADILDPFSTSKNTTARALGGYDEDFVALNSGAFFNNAAVDQLDLSSADGANLVTGSRFSLYGLKAGA